MYRKIFALLFVLILLAVGCTNDAPEVVDSTPAAVENATEEVEPTETPSSESNVGMLPLPSGHGCTREWKYGKLTSVDVNTMTGTVALALKRGAIAPEGWETCVPVDGEPEYQWYTITVQITEAALKELQEHRNWRKFITVPAEAMGIMIQLDSKLWIEKFEPTSVGLAHFCVVDPFGRCITE